MKSCIDRGLKNEGIMPGGLKVRRRARSIHDKLQEEWRSNKANPLLANDWLSPSMPWPSTRKMPLVAASSPRRPTVRRA
jgi:hypothetical protein